jgi:hypothetical protein
MNDRAAKRRREWATVAGVFVVVLVVAAVWLTVDRHPPEWDYANHLEHAVHCWRDLAAGDLRAVFARSSFYPPLVPCAAGLVFRVWPSDVAFGEVVILAFLGIGMAATYVLGRRFAGGAGGVVAATLFGTAPSVVNQALRFQLDVPLASMVAVSLVTLLATDHFRNRAWTIVTGVVFGLGMLTKPPFFVYVGPACLLVLARTRGWRAWLGGACAGLLAMVIALPWYGPRLFGLPIQIQNRSFKQAREAGFPEPLSAASLAYYPLNLPTAFGVIGVLLLAVGLAVVFRQRRWFALAGLAPLIAFLVLQNKQVRYVLPLVPIAAVVAGIGFAALPKAARGAAGVAIAVAAAVQLSATAFGVPATPRLPVAGVPLVDPSPPSRADWQHRRVLDLIVRDSGGAPRAVSITPNHAHFSPANFRYYAVRDELPLRVARAWDGEPIGIEYMVLKTGDLGPPWTIDKSRRIAERLAADASLAQVFPVIGEFPLPDGSIASVRARRVSADSDVTPDGLARAVDAALRARLPEVMRDVEGLRVRLDYDAGILRGRIKRVEISVAAVTVGELTRRAPALLKLHDLRLVVDNVLINPWSATREGRFDPLDAERLVIEQATIHSGDLKNFLAQVKGFGATSFALGAGFADLSFGVPGPDVSARVRLAAADDRPFVLIAERVKVGGIPVPPLFVNWIIRNFDPSPGIAGRLPFPATVASVTVTPGAIRIGY